MKKVFTAKDIAELKRSGGALPPDAILTPQAKEVLSGGAKISTSAPAPKAAAVSAVSGLAMPASCLAQPTVRP